VQANRFHIAVVEKHADPIASGIIIAEYDYLILIGHFWFDVF